MLDSDLAKLYNVETKRINEAVNNNNEKFPERFCFRITEEEYMILKSKISTSKSKGGSRKGHTVFTEQGVAMLATILKSKIATRVSIQIMDAFVEMRKYIANDTKRIYNIESKLLEHDNKINELFNKFDKQVNNHIFFEGQIYDAYSLFIDILKEAKDDIILIDNYFDKNILDITLLLAIKITIVTSDYNKYDIDKYKKHYDNIDIIHSNKIHDRFIILDHKDLYHSGASFKDLGKKCFAINKIENEDILKLILVYLQKL